MCATRMGANVIRAETGAQEGEYPDRLTEVPSPSQSPARSPAGLRLMCACDELLRLASASPGLSLRLGPGPCHYHKVPLALAGRPQY